MTSPIARGAERAIGEIITFYSYKGGTGRSMALANVAYILATDTAHRGRRVLMIDWDLEAPGLHRYFFKDFRESFGDPGNSSYAAALKEKSGLMDFLVQTEALYRSRFPSKELPESNAESPEAVAFFQEVLRETKFTELPLRVDGIPNLKVESSYLPDQFLALADAWIQAGRPDRALKVASAFGEFHAAAAAALARAGKPDEALQRMTEIEDAHRSEPLEAIAVAYSNAGDLKRAVETAARQTNDSSKLQTYAGILAAWKARNDKRWADFDTGARFKDAWTELWWRGWGTPPRMPGGTRSSVW